MAQLNNLVGEGEVINAAGVAHLKKKFRTMQAGASASHEARHPLTSNLT
jgi:hypothetical protein